MMDNFEIKQKYDLQLFHCSTVRDENIIIQKRLIQHIIGLFSLL